MKLWVNPRALVQKYTLSVRKTIPSEYSVNCKGIQNVFRSFLYFLINAPRINPHFHIFFEHFLFLSRYRRSVFVNQNTDKGYLLITSNLLLGVV